jgi:hypothetical protein
MMMSKPIALIFPKYDRPFFPKRDRPYLPKVRSPLSSQSTIAPTFLLVKQLDYLPDRADLKEYQASVFLL